MVIYGKNPIDSTMFEAISRENQQKLSTLFSTAVDNFLLFKYR